MQNTDHSTDVVTRANLPTESLPHIIVLQPGYETGTIESLEFQRSLKQALEQATDAVIVDLMWVNTLDAHTTSVLVDGIRWAISLQKSLAFKSIDRATRQMLDAECYRQRVTKFGIMQASFMPDLEQFCEIRQQQKAQIASNVENSGRQYLPQFPYCPELGDASQFAVLRTHQTA
jgi:anti-anti-sigma regulatory factor